MKKGCFGILLIPIVLFILFCIFLFCKSHITKERLFFIPEINIYVMTSLKQADGFGYVIIGKDKSLTISNDYDFFKIEMCELCELNLYVEGNNIFLEKDNFLSFIKEINEVKFRIHIEDLESLNIYERHPYNRSIEIIKGPYVLLSSKHYFKDLYLHMPGYQNYKKIEEVELNRTRRN